MKYLILGSEGQIGHHLVHFLKNHDHDVMHFDIVNSTEEDLRKQPNSLLEKRMEECDFVYFLAFDVGGSRYLKQYQNTFDFINNNSKIMDVGFSALKKYKKPFIFASSQMSSMDYSSYGTQKRIGEYYTDTLNGVVVKFWNVYGIEKDEEKSHVITDFIKKALKNKKIDMMTNGLEERQFLYADDCSECLYNLSKEYDSLDRKNNYHITNFEWTKIIDIAKTVQSFIPCEIIPGTNKDVVQVNAKNEPDKSILKYWKPKTTVECGIKYMCEYYKNEGEQIK